MASCGTIETRQAKEFPFSVFVLLFLLLHALPAEGKVRSADKLHVKAAKFLPLVGLARSKQDPINHGHGAQYLYRPSRTAKFCIQKVRKWTAHLGFQFGRPGCTDGFMRNFQQKALLRVHSRRLRAGYFEQPGVEFIHPCSQNRNIVPGGLTQ